MIDVVFRLVAEVFNLISDSQYVEREEFSFGNKDDDSKVLATDNNISNKAQQQQPKVMPPTSVMTRLILIMVWRKLIRNPNSYSSLFGITWSLISFKYCFLTTLNVNILTFLIKFLDKNVKGKSSLKCVYVCSKKI